jgi:hypothetical protein
VLATRCAGTYKKVLSSFVLTEWGDAAGGGFGADEKLLECGFGIY